MMRLETVVALFPDLDPVELTAWIEQSWVRPDADEHQRWIFHDIDVARVRLVYDLRRDLEIPEGTMPVVLSLLDQLYEHRRVLKGVMRTLRAQPADIQAAFRAALEAR